MNKELNKRNPKQKKLKLDQIREKLKIKNQINSFQSSKNKRVYSNRWKLNGFKINKRRGRRFKT